MSNEFIIKHRSFYKVKCCIGIVAVFGNNVEQNVERVFREIASFRQSRNKINMFNLFRFCRKYEISFDIIARNGNNVEATFDFVQATFDFVERIVRLVAFDNAASTLLLVLTGLK